MTFYFLDYDKVEGIDETMMVTFGDHFSMK